MSEVVLTEKLEEIPILPGGVPVEMPDLPIGLAINTVQQFKAISDPLRMRILNIIRHQPATAKQLATRLEATPGAIGHHLHVLEEAGLAQVVARRIVRGIIAKYYTRSARIFEFDFPSEIVDEASVSLSFLTVARDELSESLLSYKEGAKEWCGFPHSRIAPERAAYYRQRLEELSSEFLQEPVDPNGEVYGMSMALFKAPPWQSVIKETEE